MRYSPGQCTSAHVESTTAKNTSTLYGISRGVFVVSRGAPWPTRSRLKTRCWIAPLQKQTLHTAHFNFPCAFKRRQAYHETTKKAFTTVLGQLV